MLSDERIRQIAEDIYCSEGTRAEIEHSIRAALAEAAQSVPVMERNQCDGCNRGLQVCDDGLHREPSGHPVMACTRNKYTHSIPATELASLREKAAMVDELRKDAERYRWLRDDAFEHSDDCFMEAGRLFAEKHGVAFDDAIDAAIAQEGK